MGISARTSHSLHQALGDEAAEDVVNWMHQMEASRTELRELNELNHSRFDARMDARVAHADARMSARIAESDARMSARIAESDARMSAFERHMDARFAEFRDEIRSEMSALRLDLRGAIGDFDARIERRFADLLKWSFVFWVGAVGAVAVLAKALR